MKSRIEAATNLNTFLLNKKVRLQFYSARSPNAERYTSLYKFAL